MALLLWTVMYQPRGVNPAFATMALRRDDGSARPAWDEWVVATADRSRDTAISAGDVESV